MNATLPRAFQLFIGVAKVLAAVGLTLAGVTRIQPWLVSYAAGGLMIIMVSATMFHIVRGEVSSAITTVSRVLARQYTDEVGPWRAYLRIISGTQG
jgi:hypothetical protein